jgi:hypothetical protein
MFGGLVLSVIVVMVAGPLKGVVVALGLFGFLALLVAWDRYRRSLLSRALTRAGWWGARSRGANLYRSGPLGRAEWGTFRCPGWWRGPGSVRTPTPTGARSRSSTCHPRAATR